MLLLQMWQTYCDFDDRNRTELLWIRLVCDLQLRFYWKRVSNCWHNLQRTLPVLQPERTKKSNWKRNNQSKSHNRQRRPAKTGHWSRHYAGVAGRRGAKEKHTLESRLVDRLHLLHCSHWYNVFRALSLTVEENQMEKWLRWPVSQWLWQLGQRKRMHKSHFGSLRMRWRKKHKNR